MPAWMDLRIIDACPIHKRFLLTACAMCNRKLGLHRPSLLRCSCGANLGDQHCEETSDDHRRLIAWLVEIVGGDCQGPASMHLPGLPPMTLPRLLELCRGLSSLHSRISKECHASIAQRAACMLRDWPLNLHRMLDLLAAEASAETTHGAVLLSRHANPTYKHFFKRVTDAQDVAALLEVLASYVPGDINQAKSALEISHARQRIGMRDLARKRPEAARVKSDSAAVCEIDSDTLHSRKAAARLGVPVTVLKYLRRTGHFEAKNAANWSSAFSLKDVETFERKVSELPLFSSSDGIAMTVERALSRSAKGDSKGIFAAAVLDGRIRVVGRTGPLLWNLLVDSEQAENLRHSLRRANFGGTLSCAEAGAILGLSPAAVASACRLGILGSYKCVAGFRVYDEAVGEFRGHFAPLSEVAHAAGSGPKWVSTAAEQVGVELFRDPVRPTKNVFMRRSDMALVVEHLAKTPRGIRRPRGSNVNSALGLKANQEGVESLIARRLFIPRRGQNRKNGSSGSGPSSA